MFHPFILTIAALLAVRAFAVEAQVIQIKTLLGDGSAFGPHENKCLVTVDGGQIAGTNLLVPARAVIKITYAWPGSHTGHAHWRVMGFPTP